MESTRYRCVFLTVCTGLLALGCSEDPKWGDDFVTESASESAGDGASGTGASASGTASATGGGTDGMDGGSGTSAGDDGGPKLDVGNGGETDGCGEGGDGGLTEIAFSNIWIANSPEGTVSKIDTVTGDHVGRFRTGAGASDPSRTSVNLQGDVAALNRGGGGGIVKIAAETDRCKDRNGNGSIETSSSDTDVLPWGEDECVLWDISLHAGARAVAWDSGNNPEDEDCDVDPSLWVSALDGSMTIHIWRLDGTTGDEEDSTTIPNWDGSTEWGGMYGGAVDKDRNFWTIGKVNHSVFRVDYDTMEVTRYDGPATVSRFYGIAMDGDGNPHVTAEFDNTLYKFDIQSEMFVELATINGTLRGLAVDENGDAWVATNATCGLAHYKASDGSVTPITLPECNVPVGVSVDIDDYIWVVDQWAGAPPFGRAHKIDRTTYNIEFTVMGFDTPYTYSDMTGAGLNLVNFPPQG